MSDQVPATRPPETAAAAPAAAPPQERRPAVVLTALALALLAGGVFWLIVQQQDLAARMAAQESEALALREELRAAQRRVVALEGRPVAAPAAPVDLRPLELRLATLEARPAVAGGAPDPMAGERMAALEQRLARAELAAARAPGLVRLAAALEAGRPLGALTGAPPALARYAAVAPPTEAGLRLSFAEAARRARAASQPAAAQGVVERLWQRLGSLVTVRAGEAVLLGSPAAGVLGVAGERLTAGDLAGAVAALDALDPAAAAAMAEWRGQAAGLLAARAALAAVMAE